jgi:hypothetical protein
MAATYVRQELCMPNLEALSLRDGESGVAESESSSSSPSSLTATTWEGVPPVARYFVLWGGCIVYTDRCVFHLMRHHVFQQICPGLAFLCVATLLYCCRSIKQSPRESGVPGSGGVGKEAPHYVDRGLRQGPGVFGVSALVVEIVVYSFVAMYLCGVDLDERRLSINIISGNDTRNAR